MHFRLTAVWAGLLILPAIGGAAPALKPLPPIPGPSILELNSAGEIVREGLIPVANLGPLDESGRPLPPSWWVPGAVYAAAYVSGLNASLVAAFVLESGHHVGRVDPFVQCGCCCSVGVEAFLFCYMLPLVSARWL